MSESALTHQPRTKRKRKSNYSLYIIAGFILALLLFTFLALTVFFKVKTVAVIGSSVYSADELAAASGITAGQPMLLTDKNSVIKSIRTSFIYVDDVKLRLSFPSTVLLEVIPAQAAVNVLTEGGYLYLTKSGRVLEKKPAPKGGCLIISGADAAADLLPGEQFRSGDEHKPTLINTLSDNGFGVLTDKIAHVDISDRGNIKFNYDNRIEVNIGTYADLDYKVKFIHRVLTENIGPNTYGTLSMLTDGALQFIDSDGKKYNDKIYEENLATRAMTTTTEPEETAETG
jgi:cell division protein FtsQ